jgi:CBS-domain-containing membrane protein
MEVSMSESEKDTHDCELTDEDLRAALKEIRTYIDVSIDDLKLIYSLAKEKARQRRTRDIGSTGP